MVDSQKNGVIISVVVTDIQNVDQYHSHSSLLKWLPEVVSPHWDWKRYCARNLVLGKVPAMLK